MKKDYEMKNNKLKFNSKIYIKNNIKYYKINRNQLLILDALVNTKHTNEQNPNSCR